MAANPREQTGTSRGERQMATDGPVEKEGQQSRRKKHRGTQLWQSEGSTQPPSRAEAQLPTAGG
eukprot:4739929-Alexandrium_andersonii.AAC.1